MKKLVSVLFLTTCFLFTANASVMSNGNEEVKPATAETTDVSNEATMVQGQSCESYAADWAEYAYDNVYASTGSAVEAGFAAAAVYSRVLNDCKEASSIAPGN